MDSCHIQQAPPNARVVSNSTLQRFDAAVSDTSVSQGAVHFCWQWAPISLARLNASCICSPSPASAPVEQTALSSAAAASALTAWFECLNLELAMIESLSRLVVRGSPPLASAAGLAHVAPPEAAVLIIPAKKLIS
jgi:hypothetical protein